MDDPSFPKGLRVLAVDDDRVFLYILERMLHCCKYEVTTCDRGEDAMSILREDKNKFDIILCDLHMPEIDGIKLLEVIASEFDIPVVMMSVDASAKAVMKGVTRGACDFLVKPVCLEQLGVIWQHVLRRKQNGSSKSNVLGQIGGNINSRETLVNQSNYADNISRISGPKTENLMRRSDNLGEKQEVELEEEDQCEANHEYGANKAKKPRIIWTPELHQKFMQAVQQLGAEKAVPKKILESMQQMGVTDLTRENVASHLQKFRLYIRRNSDSHDQSGNSSPLLCPNSFDQSSSSPSCYQFQHSTHLNPTNIALALQEQRRFFNPIITTHSRQANNNLHGGVVSTNLGFGSNPNQQLPLIQQQVQMPPRAVNFQTPSNFQNAIPNGASFVNNSLVDVSNSYALQGHVMANNDFTSPRNNVGVASIHQYNNYSTGDVVTNSNYVRSGNVYSPFVKEGGGVSVQDSDSEPYLYGYNQDSAFFQET